MPIAEPLPETHLALDKNILDAWRFKKQPILQAIKDYIGRFKTPPALPAMVVFEALDGIESEIKRIGQTSEIMQRDLNATEQLMESCTILPFDGKAARIAAFVSGQLGRNISKQELKDVFIAATALAHGYGVVTR